MAHINCTLKNGCGLKTYVVEVYANHCGFQKCIVAHINRTNMCNFFFLKHDLRNLFQIQCHLKFPNDNICG